MPRQKTDGYICKFKDRIEGNGWRRSCPAYGKITGGNVSGVGDEIKKMMAPIILDGISRELWERGKLKAATHGIRMYGDGGEEEMRGVRLRWLYAEDKLTIYVEKKPWYITESTAKAKILEAFAKIKEQLS